MRSPKSLIKLKRLYPNSFVTTNIVQDVGHIVESVAKESVFNNKFDTIYIKLDQSIIKAKPGDKY